jgi:ribonuclease HI
LGKKLWEEHTVTLREVTIYTDGAATGNPGPGGYGVILVYGEHRKELSGGFRLTTNNRMEIMAAIVGLEALKSRCRVMVFSDSQYLIQAVMEGWVTRWKARNWMRTKKERAANVDLWERLLTVLAEHEVTFHFVKGHAGHPENERCDQLAVAAAAQPDLPVDSGYEAEIVRRGQTAQQTEERGAPPELPLFGEEEE